MDNIQQIIDLNMGRIDAMMSQMDVGSIRREMKTIRDDVDDMKETQLVLRDEIKSMRKEFGGLMSTLQRNFQSLLTDKYDSRTQYSDRQLDSGPYSAVVARNSLSFTKSDERLPLPSVPIHTRRPFSRALRAYPALTASDDDDDDVDLPLFSEMIENRARLK